MLKTVVLILLIIVVIAAIRFVPQLYTIEASTRVETTSYPSIGPIRNTLISKGKVAYDKNIVLSSNVNGNVDSVFVGNGSEVDSGTLLIRLEDPFAMSEKQSKYLKLEALKIKLESINNELSINQQLYTAGGISKNEINKQILERKLLVNDIELLDIDIKRLNKSRELSLFKSPVSGLVIDLFVSVNQRVNIGDKLISLVGGGEKNIIAYVDAFDMDKIWIGQSVVFSVVEDSEALRTGRVISIGKDISSIQKPNSVKVIIEPSNSIDDLLISQQLYLEFIIRSELSALRVPREFVYEKNNYPMVYIQTPKGIVQKKIKTKPGDSNFDIVISGVEVKDKLVRKHE